MCVCVCSACLCLGYYHLPKVLKAGATVIVYRNLYVIIIIDTVAIDAATVLRYIPPIIISGACCCSPGRRVFVSIVNTQQ